MGMDLRLLPQYSQNAEFSHDILECSRDYDMFDIISEVEKKNGRQVPRKGVSTFTSSDGDGSTHYGITIETAYGDEMNSVQAGELKKVLADYKTENWRNNAVIAFLNEIPDELEVWLYWH